MSGAHTPGPWTLNTQYADIEVRGPEGSGVMIAAMSPWGIAADRADPQRANARLIAAAPDLLEALEEARQGLAWYQDAFPEAVDGSDDEAMARICAAIAKATGAAS